MEVHRGEVFYADLSPVVGSEQGGVRPVLIVQNEIGNRHSPTVIAAAITSRLDKARLPTHINIRAADTGLAGPFALCEIEAVRRESGAPEYRFSGGSARWMDERHLRAKLSLSHDGGMALAFCILETET